MSAYFLSLLAALYLGVLTSISPCPLATNIAAVSYIGRKVGSARAVLLAGVLYTLGRCLLYVGLAVLVAGTAMSIPAVSLLLQKYGHLYLGPLFVILGMCLVGLVELGGSGAGMSEGMQRRIDALGIWGALVLGVLFAAAFCPTSAAWFFGLLTLAMGSEAAGVGEKLAAIGIVLPETAVAGGTIVLPMVYGVGTALPVLALGVLLAFSAQSVGKAYNILAKVEWWARMATGWLFIALGVFFSLKFVFEAF